MECLGHLNRRRTYRKKLEYFLGVDSAYKGKDKIKATLSALDAQGQVHVIDTIEIEKGDGKTV
ncbi:hypothetical protein [Enterococcus faecalis]|uniref:hypothetical protein n=1 Tax=Enterococcus faecalis TaxID=1351 RepID=UPI002163FA59|nr:hypothetical protein [Enterococcus faecalis]